MSEFEPYLTPEELAGLLRNPRTNLEGLEDLIAGHWEYARQRVAQTRIAEGADPKLVEKTLREPFGLHALEYGNIGSGIAKPEYLSSAAECIKYYIANELYIIDKNLDVVPATKETLDQLRADTPNWAAFRVYGQDMVDLAQRLIDDPESRIYKKTFPHYDAPEYPATLSSVLTGLKSLSTEALTQSGFDNLFSFEMRRAAASSTYGSMGFRR